MSVLNNEPIDSRFEVPLSIKCKVKVVHREFPDINLNGEKFNDQADVVLLIPELGRDQAIFYQIYLEEQYQENMEFISVITPIVNAPCRIAFREGGKDHSHPHFFVMTIRVEKILQKIDGEYVLVEVQPPHTESNPDGSSRFGDI